MTDLTFARYWPELQRRYRMIIFRSPDEVAEYTTTVKQQQADIETIIVAEANRINSLLEHVDVHTLEPTG